MANSEQLQILAQGANAWNRWRGEHLEIKPNLRQLDLNGIGIDLTAADLSNANLIEAHLEKVNLSDANLSGADFTQASFVQVNFTCANLNNANFTDVVILDSIFDFVDLRPVEGLETVIFLGPSSIGIQAIYQSNGEIPEAFLRGAGLPEQFIDYVKTLRGTPLEFYSCFISYSTKDEEFAKRLHQDLQNAGVRCWFSTHDIQGGKKIHEQVDDAIRVHDRLLLILSEDSMKSPWVKTEIANARQKEAKEGRDVLFPVGLVPYDEKIRPWKLFDADIGDDSAREIRGFYIPDFTNWKEPEAYQKAFKQLIDGLKSPDARPKR
jgi:hypothetical protein